MLIKRNQLRVASRLLYFNLLMLTLPVICCDLYHFTDSSNANNFIVFNNAGEKIF